MLCKKIQYATEDQARENLTRIQHSDDNRGKTPYRIYYCSFCGYFHITSQTPKEYKIKKREKKRPLRDNIKIKKMRK